jgi:pimeloyl-ACP methyl ester carboxylesterase
MIKKAKYGLLSLLIAIVVGFAMLNLLAYNHAYSMMHFTPGGDRTNKPEALPFWERVKVIIYGVNIPRPVSRRPPSDLAPDCQILAIDAGNNVTLSAWYCDRGTNTPLVILFHGHSAEKTCLLNEARQFLALGSSVLLVDFRGSGGSSESYTTIGVREADDVAAVFRYAQATLPHSSIILFGQSMGGVAILRAIHVQGITPSAVIVEAVFDTMLNTVRNRFAAMGIPSFPSAQLLVFWGGIPWGFNGFEHNPVEYAKSLTCPSLFMHGANDLRATIIEGRRVFAAAPGPKEFQEFKSVGHEAYVSMFPDVWTASVAKFMKKHIPADSPCSAHGGLEAP